MALIDIISLATNIIGAVFLTAHTCLKISDEIQLQRQAKELSKQDEIQSSQQMYHLMSRWIIFSSLVAFEPFGIYFLSILPLLPFIWHIMKIFTVLPGYIMHIKIYEYTYANIEGKIDLAGYLWHYVQVYVV
jgi:hypothetical protein